MQQQDDTPRIKFTVTLKPCGTRDEYQSTTVRAQSADEARDSAVAKVYGRDAFWRQEQGLPDWYGSVWRPANRRGTSYYPVTDRMSLDVEPA